MKKRVRGIPKFLLPKNLEDPFIIASLSTTMIVGPISSLLFGSLSFRLEHIGLKNTAITMWTWAGVNLFCCLLIPLGHYVLARYIYVVNIVITATLGCQFLGSQCYFWLFMVNMSVSAQMFAGPKEIGLRRFLHVMCASGVVLTFVLQYLNWISPEILPEQVPFVQKIGTANVINCLVILGTAIVRFEKELDHYKSRIEEQSVTMLQQAKMSTLGEMAGGVAHEINNPLAMILGNTTHLLRDLESPVIPVEKMTGKLQKIQTTVMRISKIVSALRTFSQDAENAPFHLVKVSELIEDTLTFSTEIFNQNQISVRVVGDKNLQLECRSTQISQALLNLINNSFDAIRALPEKWLEIKTEVHGTDVIITVTDSGSGIAADVATKIMQPFFTTKELGKGTGLGLSVAKGILENHQGTIHLDPSCTHTRFILTLPQYQTPMTTETAGSFKKSS